MTDGSFYDWFHRRPWLLDVPLALVLALLATVPLVGAPSGLWPLAGLTVLALLVRRTHPAVAFAAVSLGLAVRAVPVDNVMPGDIAFLPAIYSLAAFERRRWVRLAGLGVGALGALIAGVRFTRVDGEPVTWSALVATSVACAAVAFSAWLLGDLKRTRLQRIAELQDRAERLERDRERELQLAAQEERAAIAREMHDVVAHALSVIVVQSDGAAYAAERGPTATPAQSVAALKTIGATAREALSETRRLVGLLRDPTSGAELAPAAGLEQVAELVDRVRGAGVTVSVRDHGVGPVPVGVGQALYRIVQEGLTNVIKHAGPGASALVTLERVPGAVRLVVCDDGLGAAAHDGDRGHGLAGMRERVAFHGGLLTAGPLAGRGWEVRATLPTRHEDVRTDEEIQRG